MRRLLRIETQRSVSFKIVFVVGSRPPCAQVYSLQAHDVLRALRGSVGAVSQLQRPHSAAIDAFHVILSVSSFLCELEPVTANQQHVDLLCMSLHRLLHGLGGLVQPIAQTRFAAKTNSHTPSTFRL